MYLGFLWFLFYSNFQFVVFSFYYSKFSFCFPFCCWCPTPFGRRDSMKPNVFSEHQHDTWYPKRKRKRSKKNSLIKRPINQLKDNSRFLYRWQWGGGVRGNEWRWSLLTRVSCALSFFETCLREKEKKNWEMRKKHDRFGFSQSNNEKYFLLFWGQDFCLPWSYPQRPSLERIVSWKKKQRK